MDIEHIQAEFEDAVSEAPFPVDLTKGQDGKYVAEATQGLFQKFASGYFDGYCETEDTSTEH